MSDVGLEYLAKSLQHKALNRLNLFNNVNTKNKLTEKAVPVLTECLKYNHTLTELVLPKNLGSSTCTSLAKAVNDARNRRGLPLINVTGMSVSLNLELILCGYYCHVIVLWLKV